MGQTITFEIDKWPLSIERRKRNRMKLTFKLNKEETEGFNAFEGTVKPEGMSTADFIKVLFFKGVETMNIQFTDLAKKLSAEQEAVEKLEKQKEEALVEDLNEASEEILKTTKSK